MLLCPQPQHQHTLPPSSSPQRLQLYKFGVVALHLQCTWPILVSQACALFLYLLVTDGLSVFQPLVECGGPSWTVVGNLFHLELCFTAFVIWTELKLSALVIAHAILNPFQSLKSGEDEHLNMIHLPLKPSLVKHSKSQSESNKRFGHRHVLEVDGNPLADAMFGHARLMNSPATFQQAHMRLQDQVYGSSTLKIFAVKKWLKDICYAEEFWNSISNLVLSDLARVGKDAIAAKEDWVVSAVGNSSCESAKGYVGESCRNNPRLVPRGAELEGDEVEQYWGIE
ncbi:hypothetical protein EDC04DRAFT_2603660 [Pisolithus marmoratus]|nr:hypothetical protein EDC04DRAFT_2603660 [Pisolithus marmoratus]